MFEELVGDPTGQAECRDLIRRARRDGAAIGVVATPAKGSIIVEARSGVAGAVWPLPAEARQAAGEDAILMVVFAPSKSPGLMQWAANALGLTPREADLAAALLEAPSVAVAATRAGMSLESAKDRLESACRRTGARNASDLIGKLLDVACGRGDAGETTLCEVFGLTAAEARVGAGVARGETVERTAARLSLSPSTVKTYRKAVFAKAGVTRDRDFRRLAAEAERLAALKGSAELLVDHRATGEQLRIAPRPDGRRVALIDYGPASNAALLVMHGFTIGRRLPLELVGRLQKDGWRPVVIQRPGFGLTDPPSRDYLAEGADDMAGVLGALGADRAAILARDGGIATALTFAERHSSRLSFGVLLNPRATRDRPPLGEAFITSLSRALLSQPRLVAAVSEAVRPRTSVSSIRALFNRLDLGVEADRKAGARADVADHVARDYQAMMARSTRGLFDELHIFAEGWRPPDVLPGGPWRVAWGSVSWNDDVAKAWVRRGAEVVRIEGLGLMSAYTHAAELADLLSFRPCDGMGPKT
jgi:pimeloyl-ACP methyl ester carboxylesterase/DNA-binding CsgD family transcriptional regulator